MKRTFKTLLAIACLLCSFAASAYSFEVDGIYYLNINSSKEVAVDNEGKYTGTVVIPETVTYNGITYRVTSIGESAFWYCDGLTSVTIPNSVTSIGKSAFYGCTGLTSVSIPESVTSIGKSAFRDCTGLTTVNFYAKNCSYMGSDYYPVFSGCTNLTTLNIGASVENIPDYAFENRTGLTSVTIPESVTSIGDYAFYECTGLTEVTIPESVTYIGGSAFENCTGLTSIIIPNGVTTIGSSTFSGCTGLTEVTIPESVTWISSSTFSDCTGLTTVNFYAKNCSYMGSDYYPVFSGCTNLTTLNIGASVENIPDYAFYGCTGLTSVSIPESVTSIGESAFYNCRSLEDLTIADSNEELELDPDCWNTCMIEKLYLGRSLSFSYTTNDSPSLFNNNLSNVTIGENVIGGIDNIFCDITGLKIVYFNAENCTSCSFKGCHNLKRLYIGNSVKNIPRKAFYDCTELTSVTIPNSVTSIGDYAFYECTGLTEVTIPESVIWVDYQAFYDTPFYNNQPDGVVYLGKVLYAYKGTMPKNTSINIKEGTISITQGAFYVCTGLTSITIPNSVTSIGDWAFDGCTGLSEVQISDLAAWCNIKFGDYDANPLYHAKNLYLNGELVTNLVLPNNVTNISSYSFSGCAGLTSVTIPESVTSIGNGAFDGCTGLTSITIPNGVNSIGNRAFEGCTGLTSVTIPNSVTSIGNYAFRDCDKIENVYTYPIIPPTIYDDTFSPHTNNIASLHIVRGCKNAYTQAEYWNYFSNITDDLTSVEGVEADDTFSVAVVGGTLTITGTADDADVNIYNTNGALLHNTTVAGAADIALPNGIYLVQVNGVTQKVAL